MTTGRPRDPIQQLMLELVTALEGNLQVESMLRGRAVQMRSELTLGAELMLLVPLLEARQRLPVSGTGAGQALTPTEFTPADRIRIERSLNRLLNDISQDPAEWDRGRGPEFQAEKRTSHSVIKAFWKNFCNIPPFCGER